MDIFSFVSLIDGSYKGRKISANEALARYKERKAMRGGDGALITKCEIGRV